MRDTRVGFRSALVQQSLQKLVEASTVLGSDALDAAAAVSTELSNMGVQHAVGAREKVRGLESWLVAQETSMSASRPIKELRQHVTSATTTSKEHANGVTLATLTMSCRVMRCHVVSVPLASCRFVLIPNAITRPFL
jgi:hypothetical protein